LQALNIVTLANFSDVLLKSRVIDDRGADSKSGAGTVKKSKLETGIVAQPEQFSPGFLPQSFQFCLKLYS
jgi:hypothetical protein